jgi:hypothetical protein
MAQFIFDLDRYFIRQTPTGVNFFLLAESPYDVENRSRLPQGKPW